MTEESDKDIIQAGLIGALNKFDLPSPSSIFNFLLINQLLISALMMMISAAKYVAYAPVILD